MRNHFQTSVKRANVRKCLYESIGFLSHIRVKSYVVKGDFGFSSLESYWHLILILMLYSEHVYMNHFGS